jgi:hypothetical protein
MRLLPRYRTVTKLYFCRHRLRYVCIGETAAQKLVVKTLTLVVGVESEASGPILYLKSL